MTTMLTTVSTRESSDRTENVAMLQMRKLLIFIWHEILSSLPAKAFVLLQLCPLWFQLLLVQI
jgi:hypothetical protein